MPGTTLNVKNIYNPLTALNTIPFAECCERD